MHSKLTALAVAAAMSGAWLPATADTTAQEKAGVVSVMEAAPPNYSDSMARLQEAAQRLREGIQQIAQHPVGERRNGAISQAHKALFDVQQAMIHLPPELYLKEGRESLPNNTVAMERLQQAAQKLREAVQAMAQQPAGDRRNAALKTTREALVETQQAMIELPMAMRSQLGAQIAGERGARATGYQAPASTVATAEQARSSVEFDRLDCNRDGRITRLEWQNACVGS
jgi:hypothetical protein